MRRSHFDAKEQSGTGPTGINPAFLGKRASCALMRSRSEKTRPAISTRSLLAVSSGKVTRRYDKISYYSDLPAISLEQIEHFFAHYKDLEPGKTAPSCAATTVTAASVAYKRALERTAHFELRLQVRKPPSSGRRVMSPKGHKRTSSYRRSRCRRVKTDQLGGTRLEAVGIPEPAALGRELMRGSQHLKCRRRVSTGHKGEWWTQLIFPVSGCGSNA
jgi:hypothetical protein